MKEQGRGLGKEENLSASFLGRQVQGSERYDPLLLFPIARQMARKEWLKEAEPLPFIGADLWTAYELSWLNSKGKPQIAIAQFTIPCETPMLIESKSMKLYLNSFNNTSFESINEVLQTIQNDLSAVCWQRPIGAAVEKVGVHLIAHEERHKIEPLQGISLDRLDIEMKACPPLSCLRWVKDEALIQETLVSDLLRSLCKITAQPDWASIQIQYTGRGIDHAGLLAYLVSYRKHQEFHEPLVEKIFRDIWTELQPLRLSVYARYTRRGGIDINPFRSSHPVSLPLSIRTMRQ